MNWLMFYCVFSCVECYWIFMVDCLNVRFELFLAEVKPPVPKPYILISHHNYGVSVPLDKVLISPITITHVFILVL